MRSIIRLRDFLSRAKPVSSSAKRVSLHSEPSTGMPLMYCLSLFCMASDSTASRKRYGEIQRPCLTPLEGAKYCDVNPLLMMAVLISVNIK